MHASRVGSGLPKWGVALAAALAFAAAAPDAHAAGAAIYTKGLHVPTGSLVDPNGHTWVSDHNAGFCRVSEPDDDGAGMIEHPERPNQGGPRTCLGGLLPDAAPGPDAAGTPVLYDPTPELPGNGDDLALIPDGASPSSEVVRARWNEHTGLFEFDGTISMLADRGRPNALSLGSDHKVYVTFQRENTIQRITEPEAATPTVEIVGRTADERGAAAVAAGEDAAGNLAVYVAETTGLRVLRPAAGTATTAPLTTASTLLDGAEGGVPGGIGAMTYDRSDDVLLVGTADAGEGGGGEGSDRLLEVDVPAGTPATTKASGFSVVGGVSVRPDGAIHVLDDPAILDPAEPLGVGRMFHIGLPVGEIAAGPLAADGSALADREYTNNRRPGFKVAGEGELSCRLSGGTLDAEWESCAPETTFVPQADLQDGTYTFAVRATIGETEGIVQSHRFTVDTTPPLPPRVVRPVDETVSAEPWFEFAGEAGATYGCEFDAVTTSTDVTATETTTEPAAAAEPQRVFEDCEPGRTKVFADTEPTAHTLAIVAKDRAGNVSEPSTTVSFTVDPSREPTPPFAWNMNRVLTKGSSLFADGLHISTGALVDPDGRTWITDHNAGFCRVIDPTEDGPGRIEHPQLPGDLDTQTCLGGLLPGAGQGPDAAGQPVFIDPTPDQSGSGDEIALIPDGASPSSDVVRVQWDRRSGLFKFKDIVTMNGARTRPVAASLGADGNVYVVFQRSGTIQRIVNPTAANWAVETVGTTQDGRRGAAIAAGVDEAGVTTLYIGEDAGLTQVRPNAATRPVTRASFAIPGLTAPSALAYDHRRNHLYVGTADGVAQTDAGIDRVHRVTVGKDLETTIEADRLTGYSMIGGLFVRPDGVLYVLDDPALLDPAEPMGTGRLFHVGLPAAHIVRGPLADTGITPLDPTHVSDSTPSFELEGEGVVECRVVGGPGNADSGWAPCGDAPLYTPAGELSDGEYRLLVRSVAGEETGLTEVQRFTVDVVKPAKPGIVSPAANATVGASPWFEFTGGAGDSYECRWDTETEYTTCAPGRTRGFDANATHTLQIRAVDAAGNRSPASDTVRFHARGLISEVRIAGPEGRTNNPNPVFELSSDAVDVTYYCGLVGDGVRKECVDGTKSYTDLAEGTYTFEARGVDSVGNVSPLVRRTFTVDLTAPDVAISGIRPGSTVNAAALFGLSANESATFLCAFDGAELRECGALISVAALADGPHTLRVVARDVAGNEADEVTVPFTLDRGIVAPAPTPPGTGTETGTGTTAPGTGTTTEPTVTVIDQATGQPLTIRIADIDRRVDIERLQEAGITVTVRPAQGTQLIRFRIFRESGNGRNRGGRAVAASAKRKLVATIYRKAGSRTTTVRLKPRELRRIGTGRYVIEVAAGVKKNRLGKPVTRKLTVTR